MTRTGAKAGSRTKSRRDPPKDKRARTDHSASRHSSANSATPPQPPTPSRKSSRVPRTPAKLADEEDSPRPQASGRGAANGVKKEPAAPKGSRKEAAGAKGSRKPSPTGKMSKKAAAAAAAAAEAQAATASIRSSMREIFTEAQRVSQVNKCIERMVSLIQKACVAGRKQEAVRELGDCIRIAVTSNPESSHTKPLIDFIVRFLVMQAKLEKDVEEEEPASEE